jgi:hypothetical protein
MWSKLTLNIKNITITIIVIIIFCFVVYFIYNKFHKKHGIPSNNVIQNDSIIAINKNILKKTIAIDSLYKINVRLSKKVDSLTVLINKNSIKHDSIYKRVLHTTGNDDAKWFDSKFPKR